MICSKNSINGLLIAVAAIAHLAGCGKTPDPKYVRQIEQHGIDYSESDFRYRVSRGETEIVRLYLLAGVDPNATSTRRNPAMPALCTAAKDGRTEIVALLLEYGAETNKGYYRDDKTPLMFAAEEGEAEVVSMLTKAGARVNQTEESFGFSALLYAARNGHTDIVRILLDEGTDVNFVASGQSAVATSLMLAACYGRVETVKLLLDEGARIDIKNHEGKTALDIAEEEMNDNTSDERYPAIVQLLKNKK